MQPVYVCAARLSLSVNAFIVLDMIVCVHCVIYNREDWRGRIREGFVAVVLWILTKHYQVGSVSEGLLTNMLFWSCRYVLT